MKQQKRARPKGSHQHDFGTHRRIQRHAKSDEKNQKEHNARHEDQIIFFLKGIPANCFVGNTHGVTLEIGLAKGTST